MEQPGGGLVDLDRDESKERGGNVPNWDASALKKVGGVVRAGPQPVARLDPMRMAMLGVAGLLTILWFALLFWGAVRLIRATIF